MITEALTWTPVAEPPDSDATVLLFDPDASEPVWPGYLDGRLAYCRGPPPVLLPIGLIYRKDRLHESD